MTAPAIRTELAFRRALLGADRAGAPVQDQLDAADLARELGRTDLAAMLYGAAALTHGFTPGVLAALEEANARHALWTRLPDAPQRPAGGFCFDIAVAELRSLMQLAPVLRLPAQDWDDWLPPEQSMGPPTEPALPIETDALAAQVASLARAVPERAGGETASELRRLSASLIALNPIRLDSHVDLPIDQLTALSVLGRMRHFAIAHADLLAAEPHALFERTAMLPIGALGPYFTNVSLLIRSVDDLFVLIDGAADGQADAATTEAWITLLAIHLRHHQVNELVDELGDRGMLQAIRVLLHRLSRPDLQPHWLDAVRRIRDVGLDVGDVELAVHAQQLTAIRVRIDSNEWKILGDVLAFGLRAAEAEQAYRKALFLAPANVDAQLGIEAIRTGQIPVLSGGLDTPIGRRLQRVARL